MAGKIRSVVVILIVLVLASLSFAGAVSYLLQKERAKGIAIQEELESIKIQHRIAQTKVEESKKMISTLEIKLQEAQSQVSTLTKDLEQEKTTKQETLAQLEQLKIDLEQQKGLRSNLENKLTQAQKDVESMQAQIKDLESKKVDLEKKVKDLEAQSQNVELGKIVVSPEATPTTQESAEPVKTDKLNKDISTSIMEGKILVINKDYNFAVINLGSKDGVGIGDVFSVYHNNKYLGDIKVEKIHDSMAAAGFVSADSKNKVSEGDRVVQKTK